MGIAIDVPAVVGPGELVDNLVGDISQDGVAAGYLKNVIVGYIVLVVCGLVVIIWKPAL